MSFYKGLAYLVYLESLREKLSSYIIDLVLVLIHFMSERITRLPQYWLVGYMQWEEDDGCLEKHPCHTRQVRVEDCLEVPSLPTAT